MTICSERLLKHKFQVADGIKNSPTRATRRTEKLIKIVSFVIDVYVGFIDIYVGFLLPREQNGRAIWLS